MTDANPPGVVVEPSPSPPQQAAPDRLRVAVVQLRILTNDLQDNLRRAERLVVEAAAQGCRLVVLPEAFATGLNLPRSRELAQPLDGPLVTWLADLAKRLGIHLAGGLLELEGESVFSTAVLLGPQGELLTSYRRVAIFELEGHFLASGSSPQVVSTALGRLGFVLGFDVQFPEIVRQLFLDQVEVILCPALLLRPFVEAVKQMSRARAAENCCFLLFASATGENTLAGLTYLSTSMILQSPVGIRSYSNDLVKQESILAEAGVEETMLMAELKLGDLRRLQQRNPLYKDFRRRCGPESASRSSAPAKSFKAEAAPWR